jgi:hypothetical protein
LQRQYRLVADPSYRFQTPSTPSRRRPASVLCLRRQRQTDEPPSTSPPPPTNPPVFANLNWLPASPQSPLRPRRAWVACKLHPPLPSRQQAAPQPPSPSKLPPNLHLHTP